MPTTDTSYYDQTEAVWIQTLAYIQAKIVDGEIKIVLIDFGEARNVAAIDGPKIFQPEGSLYFDKMFRGADKNYLAEPSFDKMIEWATPRYRGGKLKKHRQKNYKKYNKNYDKNKSKKITHGKKSKKRTNGKNGKTSKKNKKSKKYR